MKHKVLAYSNAFQEMYFSKDIFLLPYYIAEALGVNLEYHYSINQGKTPMPSVHRGVSFLHTKCDKDATALLKTVFFNARHSSVLFLNGSSARHMIAVWLYKHLNPSGKVVIFGDMEEPQAIELKENGFQYSKGFIGCLKIRLTDYFFNNVTYLVANTAAFRHMDELCRNKKWDTLLHFYPCLDDEPVKEYGIIRKTWEEKENVMVCVGRIGNHQKNTEMLLDALRKVDLKDWKIYMLGPITSSFDLKEGGEFQKVIDQFFEECPQHKDKLIFTGMIYDQKEVMEYYNRAKVLLSTARHEGFANTFSQAAAFGCYIISTDVGGADVASNGWTFGTMVKQEDSDALSVVLNDLTTGRLNIDANKALSMDEMTYSKRIETVLLPKMGL